MTEKIMIFLTDGYADWEVAFVSAELNKPETGFEIKTLSVDREPKRSMGGFTVLPDSSIEDLFLQEKNMAMLIMPGGTGWHEEKSFMVKRLLETCLESHIPVAAICDAVPFLAHHGYLDSVKHTGNSLDDVKCKAPNYRGQDCFVEAQAVSDGNFITANGTAPLEFTREILRRLGVEPDTAWAIDALQGMGVCPDDAVACWYALWKRGLYNT